MWKWNRELRQFKTNHVFLKYTRKSEQLAGVDRETKMALVRAPSSLQAEWWKDQKSGSHVPVTAPLYGASQLPSLWWWQLQGGGSWLLHGDYKNLPEWDEAWDGPSGGRQPPRAFFQVSLMAYLPLTTGQVAWFNIVFNMWGVMYNGTRSNSMLLL